jgi:Mrp family chromosome partitioning ATPase
LWELLIVEQHVAVQRDFQFFARTEAMALQHLLDPAVEAFDHAVGLRVLWWGQTVFDAEVAAELIELVLASGAAFAQAEQSVGELLAIVGENGADAQRAGALQIAQEAAGIGSSLGLEDADEYLAGCPVNRHE